MLTAIFVGTVCYFALVHETKNRKIALAFALMVAVITAFAMTCVTLTAPMLAVAVATALFFSSIFASLATAIFHTAITASAACAAFLFLII